MGKEMKFRHTCIVTYNLKAALLFYRDILGMKVWKELTLEGKYPSTILGINKVKLTYYKLDFDDPFHSDHPPRFELHYYHYPLLTPKRNLSHISITTSDIKKDYERLKNMGVKFISKPIKASDSNSTVCFCKDFEGNLIELVED